MSPVVRCMRKEPCPARSNGYCVRESFTEEDDGCSYLALLRLCRPALTIKEVDP